MICPNCGFEFNDDPLIHALREIQRDYGVIEAKAVASRINYSPRTIQRKLKALETVGVIFRYGQRKGWFLRT